MAKIKITKAYLWVYHSHQITTTLVKNGVWRWYSSSHGNSVSGGSNALTFKGAMRDYTRQSDEYYMKIAAQVPQKEKKTNSKGGKK